MKADVLSDEEIGKVAGGTTPAIIVSIGTATTVITSSAITIGTYSLTNDTEF